MANQTWGDPEAASGLRGPDLGVFACRLLPIIFVATLTACAYGVPRGGAALKASRPNPAEVAPSGSVENAKPHGAEGAVDLSPHTDPADRVPSLAAAKRNETSTIAAAPKPASAQEIQPEHRGSPPLGADSASSLAQDSSSSTQAASDRAARDDATSGVDGQGTATGAATATGIAGDTADGTNIPSRSAIGTAKDTATATEEKTTLDRATGTAADAATVPATATGAGIGTAIGLDAATHPALGTSTSTAAATGIGTDTGTASRAGPGSVPGSHIGEATNQVGGIPSSQPGGIGDVSDHSKGTVSAGNSNGRDPTAAAGESIAGQTAKDAGTAKPGDASDLSAIVGDGAVPTIDRNSTGTAGESSAQQTAKDARTVEPGDASDLAAIDNAGAVSAGDRSGGDLTGVAGESFAEQAAKDVATADPGDGQHAGGTSVAGDNTSDVKEAEPIARISVPNSKVDVDEQSWSQTLGGMLPLVLGVNEDGRFDFDQYLLRPEVKRVLDDLASKLQTAEYDRLDVTGYADRIGTVDHNQRLSELRAWAVAQYLIAAGVPDNKIHFQGRGQEHPLTRPGDCNGMARDALIVCLQKDRRVEIEASIHRKHATIVQ